MDAQKKIMEEMKTRELDAIVIMIKRQIEKIDRWYRYLPWGWTEIKLITSFMFMSQKSGSDRVDKRVGTFNGIWYTFEKNPVSKSLKYNEIVFAGIESCDAQSVRCAYNLDRENNKFDYIEMYVPAKGGLWLLTNIFYPTWVLLVLKISIHTKYRSDYPGKIILGDKQNEAAHILLERISDPVSNKVMLPFLCSEARIEKLEIYRIKQTNLNEEERKRNEQYANARNSEGKLYSSSIQ